jgi:lipoate-protein ligase A
MGACVTSNFAHMPNPPLCLVRHGFPNRPAFGTAVARATLVRVAAGELPATLRLHRTAPVLAFSRQDLASHGFADAVHAARERGFEPVLRLAGGRAAVFHEETLACGWAVSDPRPPARTTERFRELAGMLSDALRNLGVGARVGEIPGEYCPGAWSVNAGGRIKLAGIGQRLIARGAHRGAVIVVGGSRRLRDVLIPVYEALELEWDPATAGSVADEVGELGAVAVEEAILAAIAERYDLREEPLDRATLGLAEQLEAEHRVGLVSGRRGYRATT